MMDKNTDYSMQNWICHNHVLGHATRLTTQATSLKIASLDIKDVVRQYYVIKRFGVDIHGSRPTELHRSH